MVDVHEVREEVVKGNLKVEVLGYEDIEKATSVVRIYLRDMRTKDYTCLVEYTKKLNNEGRINL